MSSFSIRKLYVDVVDETGTVWVFYFVNLCFGWFCQRLAGVERYPRIGPPSFGRVQQTPLWPTAPRENEQLDFRMQLAEGPVEFSAVSTLPPWIPSRTRLSLPIQWHVVAPRLDVKLRHPGAETPVTGVGYADLLELRGLPRALRLRHLRWGRAHTSQGGFIFTSVVPQHGSSWQRAVAWNGTMPRAEWEQFSIEERFDGMVLRPSDRGQHLEPRFFLGKERVLRQGASVDAGRFPHAIERFVYRSMMGRAIESRWCGAARLWPEERTIFDSAIHESVDFGAAGAPCQGGAGSGN